MCTSLMFFYLSKKIRHKKTMRIIQESIQRPSNDSESVPGMPRMKKDSASGPERAKAKRSIPCLRIGSIVSLKKSHQIKSCSYYEVSILLYSLNMFD